MNAPGDLPPRDRRRPAVDLPGDRDQFPEEVEHRFVLERIWPRYKAYKAAQSDERRGWLDFIERSEVGIQCPMMEQDGRVRVEVRVMERDGAMTTVLTIDGAEVGLGWYGADFILLEPLTGDPDQT